MIRVRSVVSGITLLAFATTAASAQKGYEVGYTDIGPVIGFGSIGDAGISIGGRFERAIKALPDLGNGVLGIGVGVDWYSYNFGVADYKLTYIPISATANYHFHVENKKIDPFIGLGLGYLSLSSSFKGAGSYSASGVFFAGRAGMRVFVGDKAAVYGDVGTGGGALHVGVTFRVGGA